MKVSLAGKIVIVTGAASGIGAAIARAAAGADVAGLCLTDRDSAGLAKVAADVAPIATVTCVADLADPEAPAAIAAAALGRFGRIDGLANAAGLTDRASLLEGGLAQWDALFAVNTRAPFFLMQAAIKDMLRRGAKGEIVNILSVNAHCGAADLAIYSATKGALLTLTKNAAHAHMAAQIRVNGINLGWVATPGEHRMQSVILGRGPDWAARDATNLPLGRFVDADEAARLTLFLLSDSSAPMTGLALDLEQRVVGAP